jgi:hydrogenase maturation protease
MDTRSHSSLADAPSGVVVLGIGNVLWADEGFGVRAVEALGERYVFAPSVALIDGGTQGLNLLRYVQAADRLLILDAVDYGLPPGTLHVVEGDDVPRFLGAKKMSLHQTGFQEVLALAELTGRYPREIVLVGCQPEELEDYGGSLRPVVARALEAALDVALARLSTWGAAPAPRTAREDSEPSTAVLSRARYEGERPAPSAACRVGDARFIPGWSEG